MECNSNWLPPAAIKHYWLDRLPAPRALRLSKFKIIPIEFGLNLPGK
jgi:hypothetical protein